MRAYKVYAIERGTVIDHIEAGKALKVIDILKLDGYGQIVTVGMNFDSKKTGKKDIVKIEKKTLSKAELNRIALIAPNATINIIKKGKVAEKFKVAIPKEMQNLIQCPNPKCITRNETVTTIFYKKSETPLKVKCHYCEKAFTGFELI